MKKKRTQFSSQIVFEENYVYENAKFFWLWHSYNFDLKKWKKMSTKFHKNHHFFTIFSKICLSKGDLKREI